MFRTLKSRRLRAGAGVLAGAALTLASAVAADRIELPDIGASSRTVLSSQREQAIGEALMRALRRDAVILEDPEVETYLQGLGQRVVAHSDGGPERFTFFVVQDPRINAFAAPGGLILVTRGLLKCCQNEDELAAVLAHEIGHVEKQHGLRAIKTGRLNSALTILAVEAGKNLAGEQLAEVTQAFDESINDITGTLMNSGYSRKLEYEADAAAVAILKQSGYQPGALAAMLENMAKNWDASRRDFAATHPAPADRLAELRKIGVVSSVVSANARQQRFLAATQAL